MIPVQKLKKTRKTKEWGRSVLDHLDSVVAIESSTGRVSRSDKQAYYDLFNGYMDENRVRYVLDDVKPADKSFPAQMRHYDKISPNLMLLSGEEAKRPFNFRVINKSQSAYTRAQEKKKEMLLGLLKQQLQNKIPEQGQPQSLPEIDKYMSYNYKDIYEVSGNSILSHLIDEQALQSKFNEGFKDALISTEEIYWVGEIQGKPIVRLCNPLYVTVLTSPDSPWIEDAWAVIEDRYLTIPDIIDEFYKDLSDSEINDLEAKFRNENDSPYKGYERPFVVNAANPWVSKNDVMSTTSPSGIYKVTRYEWQSMRLVGFIEYTDEFGYDYVDIVGEEYEPPTIATKIKEGNQKGSYSWTDEIGITYTYTEYWINEWWEGTKIHTNGDPIYLNIKAKEIQRRSMDNPSICKSGYVGYVYNARNSKPVSLVGRMESIQYLYNIIYYRTELAFAKSFGNTQIWDLAMFPKSHISSIEEWMYYGKAMGVLFVNSAEGIQEGRQSPMNVMKEIDGHSVQYINSHLQLLMKLEDELEQVCGISRQRKGQISTNELVGATERAVTQSSHITEYWFTVHNEVKGRVLNALLDHAQHAFKNGFKIQYIADDAQRMFIELSDDEFSSSEFNIFVNNSSKENRAIESLRSLAEQAISSGAGSLSDVAKIIWSDSLSEITKQLEKSEADKNQREQQMQQQQMQMQDKINQDNIAANERSEEREDLRRELDRQNKIEVALISHSDQPEEDGPDELSVRKQEFTEKKYEEDKAFKNRQQSHKEKTDKEKIQIQRSKPKTSK